MSTGKQDGDYVKLKIRRDPTYSTLDLYESSMYLFDHDKPQKFILFVRNFQMNLAAMGALETKVKVQYLCMLVRGEALYQFDLLSADMKNTETPLDVDHLVKVLVWHFYPVNSLSKKKRVMRRCMKNPHRLKVRRYAAGLIYLNEYLISFPGATMADKKVVTELNDILLNRMPNSWSKQAYVQGFDCETISFKKFVNMFERM